MPRSLCSTQAASCDGLSCSAGTPRAETMRPRSIGTSSSLPCGARSWMNAANRSASCEGMSRKKNDGALSGSEAENCWRRLPSISITVTSSASPRPSDITTAGVSAPGRWMLAIAIRHTVERGRPSAAAPRISKVATKRSSTNTAPAAIT